MTLAHALILSAYVLLSLAFVRYAIVNPGALLALYVATIPWYGIQADLGLTVNIDRIGAAVIFLLVIVRSLPVFVATCGVLTAYMTAISAGWSVSLPETIALFSAWRGEYRWIGQVLLSVTILAPVAALADVRRWRTDVSTVLRVVVISVAVLCVLGLIQLFVFTSLGVDLFPIGIADSTTVHRSATYYGRTLGGGSEMLRVSSLGGEPKHLALSIVVALTAVLVNHLVGNPLALRRRTSVALTLLFAVTLVFTFSTQGLVLVAANTVIAALLASLFSAARSFARLLRGIFVAVPLGLAALWVPGLIDQIEERTVVRLQGTGFLEDWNQAVLDWLMHDPAYGILGVGLGNVHLFALHFIPNFALDYMSGQVFVAKSGALRIVSELGVVGLVIVGVMFLRPVVRAVRLGKAGDPLSAFVAVFLPVVLLDYFVTADGPVYIFVALGLAYAAIARARHRLEHRAGPRVSDFGATSTSAVEPPR